VAVLYRGHEEAFRQASFLAGGLAAGDVCCYLAPHSFHAAMLERLRPQSPDLARHLESNQLRIHEGPQNFLALRAMCQQVFLDAESRSAPSVRWLEEGIWPEPVGFPMPDFFEFHALLNYQVKHYPSVAICQYDLDRFEARHLFQAIAVHRHLIIEGTLVRDNPFYIPAEKFMPLSAAERERDLLRLFRDLDFNMTRLLGALAGYGKLPSRNAG
jgi:hypothetical protein